MNKKQLDHLFKKYKEDPFIRYEWEGDSIKAINIHTGCEHIFVTGETKIKINRKNIQKVKDYVKT